MPSFDLPTPVVPHMTIRGFEDIVVRAANDLLKMLIWLILRKADERIGIERDRPWSHGRSRSLQTVRQNWVRIELALVDDVEAGVGTVGRLARLRRRSIKNQLGQQRPWTGIIISNVRVQSSVTLKRNASMVRTLRSCPYDLARYYGCGNGSDQVNH